MSKCNTTDAKNYPEYCNLLLYLPTNLTPVTNTDLTAFSQVFLPILYSIIFVSGIIGNGLVVCVLVKYHKTSNMSDLCLLNLALSDLLFLFSLPFWAHYAAVNSWNFGGFMCQVLITLFMLGFYGSIFLMILMTVDRYIIIVHAHTSLFSKHRSGRTQVALVLFMWALSLGASLPTIIFSEGKNESDVMTCSVDYPKESEWTLVSYIELNILGFIIPLLVMVFCYSRIISILMTMKSQKKHKAVKLMVVLVIVFFLFWTPYNIVIFLKFLRHLGYQAFNDQDLQMPMLFVETLAFSHCCLNPIIYAFVGQKFRNLFLKILKEWFPLCFDQCTTVESELSERVTTMHSRLSENSRTKTKSEY